MTFIVYNRQGRTFPLDFLPIFQKLSNFAFKQHTGYKCIKKNHTVFDGKMQINCGWLSLLPLRNPNQ